MTARPDPAALRLAGFFYLVIIVAGIWSEGVARASLIVAGDAAATMANIAAAPGLYRASLAADLVMALADAGLAVVLFLVLRSIHQGAALAAMVLRLMQGTVLASMLIFQLGALRLATSGGPAETVLLFTEMQSLGYDLGLVFFGVNSLITGWLLMRAGWLSPAFGAALAAAGVVYLTGSFLRFLAPALHGPFQYAYIIPLIAETALALRLLAAGLRRAAPSST